MPRIVFGTAVCSAPPDRSVGADLDRAGAHVRVENLFDQQRYPVGARDDVGDEGFGRIGVEQRGDELADRAPLEGDHVDDFRDAVVIERADELVGAATPRPTAARR